MAWDENKWSEQVSKATTGQELIDLAMTIPDDLPLKVPEDQALISNGLVKPSTSSTSVRLSKMDASSPTPTLRPLLLGEMLAVMNGTLAIPPGAVFETAQETMERLQSARQSEAQRLKERLSAIPWHARRAQAEGEAYWMRLAGSYQGD